MDDGGRQPTILRECLRAVSKKLGLGGSLEAARVWSSWTEIAGTAIAHHAEPTSLRDGVLRIRTDSPTWATEIGYMGAEIARRANAVIGKPIVSEVRIWMAPGPIARAGSAKPVSVRAEDRKDAPAPDPASDPARALARARTSWARHRRPPA